MTAENERILFSFRSPEKRGLDLVRAEEGIWKKTFLSNVWILLSKEVRNSPNFKEMVGKDKMIYDRFVKRNRHGEKKLLVIRRQQDLLPVV